jgi:uncharacterized membrane protein
MGSLEVSYSRSMLRSNWPLGLVIISVWVCLFTIGIIISSDKKQVKRNRRAYHTLVWVGAISASLILAPYLRHPWDFDIWISTAEDLLSGRNPYDFLMAETLRRGYNFPYYDYPPLWALILLPHYILYLIQPIHEIEVLRTILKIPLIATNLLTGYLLYTISRDKGEKVGLIHFVAFSLNPFILLMSSGAGLHDGLAAFFSLLAFLAFHRGKRDFAALALGLAISAKMYPIFLLAPFILFVKGAVQKIRFAVLSAVPLTMLSIPFILWNPESYIHMLIIRHAASRPHGFSLWELCRRSWFCLTGTWETWVFPNYRFAMPIIILSILGICAYYFGKEKTADNLSSACLAVTLIVTIIAVESHPPFFIWISPFILLRRTRHTWLAYTLLTVSLYLYIGVGYPIHRYWGKPLIPGYRGDVAVSMVMYPSGIGSVLIEVYLLLSTLGLEEPLKTLEQK